MNIGGSCGYSRITLAITYQSVARQAVHRTRVFQVRCERVVLAVFYPQLSETPATLWLQLPLLSRLVLLHWLRLAVLGVPAL